MRLHVFFSEICKVIVMFENNNRWYLSWTCSRKLPVTHLYVREFYYIYNGISKIKNPHFLPFMWHLPWFSQLKRSIWISFDYIETDVKPLRKLTFVLMYVMLNWNSIIFKPLEYIFLSYLLIPKKNAAPTSIFILFKKHEFFLQKFLCSCSERAQYCKVIHPAVWDLCEHFKCMSPNIETAPI